MADEYDKQALFEALAEELGYELEGDDEPRADAPRDPRVDSLYEEYEQRQREEDDDEPEYDSTHERRIDIVEGRTERRLIARAAELGIDLEGNDEALDLLFDKVLELPLDSEGRPDVDGALGGLLDHAKASGFDGFTDDGEKATTRAVFAAQQAAKREAFDEALEREAEQDGYGGPAYEPDAPNLSTAEKLAKAIEREQDRTERREAEAGPESTSFADTLAEAQADVGGDSGDELGDDE